MHHEFQFSMSGYATLSIEIRWYLSVCFLLLNTYSSLQSLKMEKSATRSKCKIALKIIGIIPSTNVRKTGFIHLCISVYPIHSSSYIPPFIAAAPFNGDRASRSITAIAGNVAVICIPHPPQPNFTGWLGARQTGTLKMYGRPKDAAKISVNEVCHASAALQDGWPRWPFIMPALHC